MLRGTKENENVIPTKVGIQSNDLVLDSCFRRNDVSGAFSSETTDILNFNPRPCARGDPRE